MIRRIGDRESTNIRTHNGIPRDNMMQHVSSLVQHPSQRLSKLIDATSATWWEELVQSVFLPFDAEAILQITLCTEKVEDFWVWSTDHRGLFSAHSAYNMIVNMKLNRDSWLEEREGPSKSQVVMDGYPSGKLGYHQNLRCSFGVAQHSLPKGDMLHHRNMSTTCICPF